VVAALILMSVGWAPAGSAAPGWPGGDPSVAPGADFYAHANGGWTAATEIPPDRAGFSTATILTQTAEAKVRALLEAAAAGPAQGEAGQVGAYYRAFMDAGRIDSLGGRPLARDLAAINAATTRGDLARLMGQANAGFLSSLFTLEISEDTQANGRYAVYLSQGGLGLPDRDSYLAADGAVLRRGYADYVRRMLELDGWPAASRAAADVVAFETKVAKASWSADARRDETLIYNPTTFDDRARDAPGFPWAIYITSAGLRPGRVVVRERSAVLALAAIFASTPVATLKAWAAFHLADNAAPDLSQAFVANWFNWHGRMVDGAQAQPPRWRRALKQVSGGGWKSLDDSRGAMGDAVGRLYLAQNLDPQARASLETLVQRMKATLRDLILASERMSPEAKAEALRKVDAYDIQIGGPAHGDTYEGVVLRDDDLYGDVARVTAHDWAARRARLGEAVDRGRWDITPQTVNAYNEGDLSLIVFTAALLQPPFFDPRADLATIYGLIGATIGHELTHGFDDQGRHFDASGRLRNWWTPEDDARFARLSQRVVDRYSTCEEAPGFRVNGKLTLGENIADIGGLQLALAAYHDALDGRPAPIIDGLTGDQRFFLAFATARRDKRRLAAIRADIQSDPRTPDPCRVNEAVREVDGWYDAFNIGPGDPLFLPKGERARIW
jgi:putative endopeptidase